MTSPLLEVQAVSFAFPGRQVRREVLREIAFSLEPGSATALIGANGAGKTTLLRVASGTLRPTAGRVLLEGADLTTFARRQRAKRIAMVPQSMEMAFQFTVRQIVEQGRAPHTRALRGLGREDRLAVDRAMDLADVTGFATRIFNELSGGERQRVRIALGLAQNATLLFLDEPTQNLDIGRQKELMKLLAVLKAEGITTLASMHDLHLVKGSFDRVLLMTPDKTLLQGTPEEVMTDKNLEWAFDCPPTTKTSAS